MFVNEQLPSEKQIVYIPWDFHEAQKKYVIMNHRNELPVLLTDHSDRSKNEDPVAPLVAIAEASLVKTGLFYSGMRGRKSTGGLKAPSAACEQSGVIRTNWYHC